nr:ribonuclease H-like domain-containing protein [Tanacetum cinerariifolium]
MTRNKAYLIEYQEFNGGPVAFGGSKGQITDTECLVLSPDFKLPNENQVLLRVPRQNNMYSFNLENIAPLKLGKFDGKSDEGIFVGYSTTSKAFRVYNIRTRKVEENLHITFLKNKPMIAGGRPEKLFDIDALSKSMNYASVSVGINSNHFAGKGASFDAGQSSMDIGSSQDSILMPL